MNTAAQRKQPPSGAAPDELDAGRERDAEHGEAARPSRGRRRGGTSSSEPRLCSWEDAFWWTAAMVALLFVGNYAYYIFSASTSFSEWMGYAGTADNDPGGCHCTGDWFGEGCKARVGRTKIYLPVEADALRACPTEEVRAQMDLSRYFTGDFHVEGDHGMNLSRMVEGHAIEDVLEYLRDPLHCTHGHTQHAFKVYSIPGSLSMAQSLASAMSALSSAARAGRSFQFVPQALNGPVAPGDFCQASSRMACFLEPTSTCGAASSPPSRAIDMKDPSLEVLVPDNHLVKPRNVPARFRQLGNFWYFTQLLKFIWRPNEAAGKVVQLVEQELGIAGARMVCAVVEDCGDEGDAAGEKSRLGGCVGSATSLERVMPAVGEMGLRYNISTVFLVTDSLRAVAASSKYSKMQFKHLKFDSASALERLQHGAPPPPAAQWLGGTRFAEAPRTAEFTPRWAMELVGAHADLREFVELELMSRCAAFVGPFAAGKVQVGYQLAVAKQGWYPAFISTDAPLALVRPPLVVGKRDARHHHG